MRTSIPSFFASQWRFFHLLVGVLIITVLVLEALGAGVTHATDGKAHFDIEPIFVPYRDMRPRANFMYASSSGAVIQDSIHVKNYGSAPGTIDIYPVDAITSQGSGEAFPRRTDPRRDVGAWITLSRQQVTLNPGQSQDIPFSLRIPDHARPGQHLGGLIAEAPVQQQSSSKGAIQAIVQIHIRKAISVFINLPGTIVKKLNAAGVSYDEASSHQRVLIALANTGTQFLHPSGSLKITNAAGQQLQNVPLKLGALLPQTSIHYPVFMQHTALNPGTYTATLNLAYEGNHKLNYSTSFVVPLPQVPKISSLPPAISDLVTLNADFFSTLTPWHYAMGICLLFCMLSTLLFWIQKLYKLNINRRGNFKRRNRKQ
ncbi:WxL protein peptidoglycan domain-containing protein [Dictyobacter arantiisoli]|uniref:DUF3324 domain-containing protein n=1 Tax=Dictyobacter arantiisoli TaxID=2014874 RepID=A0A5A5TE63_9CHLR|nr:DUF916 domain-containing protein [Dictyobacter arantiisoli]GCF09525.1 hypothetical protein KDI_30890 [Dictyobacter arantiisoli]